MFDPLLFLDSVLLIGQAFKHWDWPYLLWDWIVKGWEWTIQFWQFYFLFLKLIYHYIIYGAKVLINAQLHCARVIVEFLLSIARLIPPMCREMAQFCQALIDHLLTLLSSVQTGFGKWLRLGFDFLHSRLCLDSAEEEKSTFWPSFSCPSSPHNSREKQRDCVFLISSVVVTFLLAFVFLFVIAVWSLTRRKETRELGVDRGTNTPHIDEARAESPEREEEEEEALVGNPQIKELRNQLIQVTKLLESRGNDEVDADKDVKIEELTFENRALRQNAIDEKELQSCIVCRVEPRRVVLFPCRHLCLCESCNNHHFSSCPYCRTRCFKTEKIFL